MIFENFGHTIVYLLQYQFSMTFFGAMNSGGHYILRALSEKDVFSTSHRQKETTATQNLTILQIIFESTSFSSAIELVLLFLNRLMYFDLLIQGQESFRQMLYRPFSVAHHSKRYSKKISSFYSFSLCAR